MSETKTRIAPTPSGYLHIGNAYSFVITALIANLENAPVLLRIDDLDRERYRQKYVDDIFRSLEFLEIEWQEGPQSTTEFEKEWSQQFRIPLYEEALDQLREKKLLFECKCSRKKVKRLLDQGGYAGTCRTKVVTGQENVAWRIKTDDSGLAQKLWPKGEEHHQLAAAMRDFVVRRKDGIPAYQLASLVDDQHFGVNLVIRGADLRDSTTAQLFLAGQLDADEFLHTRFLHHSIIKDKDGRKLSKSQASGSISNFIQNGGKRAEIYRQIAKMMDMNEDVDSFSDLLQSTKTRGLPELLSLSASENPLG